MHLTRDVVLPVPAAEAWELLTDPDELATWLGTTPPRDLAPGGAIALVEPDGTARTLVVDEVVAGRRIGFTWWSDADGPQAASRVELVVEEADGGSRVTVTETVPARASVAGGVRRLAIGAGWDGRLVDLELRALLRQPILA